MKLFLDWVADVDLLEHLLRKSPVFSEPRKG